jgi:ERCC4-type nuclease
LESFKGLPHVGDVTSRVLYNEGFRSVKEVAEVDPEELAKVLDIGKEKAIEMVETALRLIQGEAKPEGSEEGSLPPRAPDGLVLDPVDRLEGVGEKTAEILKSHGFGAIQDILKSDAERLSALPGIGVKKAEKLIQNAQTYSRSEKGE